MTAKNSDIARMTTGTTGTGTITLGTNVPGYLTFTQANIADGQKINYSIEDGTNRETGWGIFTLSGLTLTRNVYFSTNSNTPINLSPNIDLPSLFN